MSSTSQSKRGILHQYTLVIKLIQTLISSVVLVLSYIYYDLDWIVASVITTVVSWLELLDVLRNIRLKKLGSPITRVVAQAVILCVLFFLDNDVRTGVIAQVLVINTTGGMLYSQIRPLSRIQFFSVLGLATVGILLAIMPSWGVEYLHIRKGLHHKIEMGIVPVVVLLFYYLNMMLKNYRSSIMEIRNERQEKEWYASLFNLVAHNLRTPLSTLVGTTQILGFQKGRGGDIEINESQYERIESAVNQLDKVVNYVFNAPIGPQSDITIYTLNDLAKALQKNFTKLEIKEDPNEMFREISEHEAYSMSVVLNILLENAYKYGGKNVVLEIKNRPVKSVVVRDDGMGMNQGEVQRYGKAFSGKREEGISVFFAVGILKNVGWDLRISSALGQGTEIELAEKELLHVSEQR